MNKTLLLNLFLCSFLAACGGGGGSSSSSENSGNITDNTGDNTDNNGSDTDTGTNTGGTDTGTNPDNTETAPTVTLEKPWAEDGSTILTASESLIFNFSEPMQINTLALSGNMLPDCGDETDSLACLDLAWNQDTTQLTVTPKDGFYWYANNGSFEMAITGDGELGLNTIMSATVLPVFKNHQAADVVIGQESFTNRTASVGDKEFSNPTTVNLIEKPSGTSLLISDSSNNRVVKYDTIPTSNYASHSALFGQTHIKGKISGTNVDKLDNPVEATYLDGMIHIADSANGRVIALAEEHFSHRGNATFLLGKHDFRFGGDYDCASDNLSSAPGLETVKVNHDVYWLVADSSHDRVMVWKNPTSELGSEASYVLGQETLDTCTDNGWKNYGLKSIGKPIGIWSNGVKLIVVSGDHKRLLIWNEFPTETGVVPDFQLGQEDEYGSQPNAGQESINQKGFRYPSGIGGNDHQICVTDAYSDRVTVWHTLPSSSDDLADVVIGQQDFDSQSDGASINSKSLNYPNGCDISMEQLFVADTGNHRVLVYNALNKRP